MKKEKVIRTNDLPTSEAQLKTLRGMINEGANALVRAQLEKESHKSIVEAILEEYPITKKLVNKLIKIQFKQNYAELSADNEALEEAYTTLFGDDAESDDSNDE